METTLEVLTTLCFANTVLVGVTIWSRTLLKDGVSSFLLFAFALNAAAFASLMGWLK